MARHAAAQAVHIELNAQEGCVMLDIRDDGVGIDLAKIDGRHSLGLLGMRERALQCGATLQVRRIEPRGTCVSVRIPRSSLNHGAQA